MGSSVVGPNVDRIFERGVEVGLSSGINGFGLWLNSWVWTTVFVSLMG